MAIVGPSVYLLTRKDSLCYNRLISLPPRTLISPQMKIETIMAVGGATRLAPWHVCCSPPPPPPHRPPKLQRPWQVQSVMGCTDSEGWRTDELFILCHCAISSSLCLHSVLWERCCAPHLCLTECVQEDAVLMIRGRVDSPARAESDKRREERTQSIRE